MPVNDPTQLPVDVDPSRAINAGLRRTGPVASGPVTSLGRRR